MPQIIVNSEGLRAFASILRREAAALREHQRALEATRRDLAQIWRDAKYASFERAYLPTVAALDRFCNAADAYAAYLRNKAEKVDRYLGQR
jgi:uncharacterized protein YukE